MQLEAWDRDGYLHIKNALPTELISQLDGLSNDIAALPKSDASNGVPHPWLIHHEKSKVDGTLNICRVEVCE